MIDQEKLYETSRQNVQSGLGVTRAKLTQPGGKIFFAHMVSSKAFHHPHTHCGIGSKSHAIQPQEREACNEGRAFVAIDKGMRLGDAMRLGRGDREHIRVAIGRAVHWPCTSHFKECQIASPRCPAVTRDLSIMHNIQGGQRDPKPPRRFFHHYGKPFRCFQ